MVHTFPCACLCFEDFCLLFFCVKLVFALLVLIGWLVFIGCLVFVWLVFIGRLVFLWLAGCLFMAVHLCIYFCWCFCMFLFLYCLLCVGSFSLPF